MQFSPETLSVSRAAALCGVSHGTVGYWIRTKKLGAVRTGRNYSIPVKELLFFLKNSGHKIPLELAGRNLNRPIFREYQTCWQFYEKSNHGQKCERCPVLLNKLDVCFTARDSDPLHCKISCKDCRYYQEIYLPRICFIYQIELPAAVYRGLHFWGGNDQWSELCGIAQEKLPGLGIEHVIHPDSLKLVISNIKKRRLGLNTAPRTYDIFLRHNQHGGVRARISVYPLSEPAETFLMLAEREKN